MASEIEELHSHHLTQRRRLRVLLKVSQDPVRTGHLEAIIGLYDDATEWFDNIAHANAKADAQS